MSKSHLRLVGAAFALLAAQSFAHAGVQITTSLPEGTLHQRFARGERVPVTLYVTNAGDPAIFGVELELAVRGRGARMVEVRFADPFTALGPAAPAADPAAGPSPSADEGATGASPADPGEPAGSVAPDTFCRVTAAQRADALDTTLGARGVPVPLATVTLEMLDDLPFAAALEVRARVALVGGLAEDITVLAGRSGNPDAVASPAGAATGQGALAIFSGVPVPSDGGYDASRPPAAPINIDAAACALSIRSARTGAPAQILRAGEIYEIWYDASARSLHGYLLYVLGSANGDVAVSLAAPDAGPWASNRDFAVEDAAQLAPEAAAAYDAPPGLALRHLVSATRSMRDDVASSAALGTFTPTGTGVLQFVLQGWEIDADEPRMAELTGLTTAAVVAAP